MLAVQPVLSCQAEKTIIWRDYVCAADVPVLQDLMRSTGVFEPEEMEVLADYVDDFLRWGDESGVNFMLAKDESGILQGFACFGPIPGVKARHDLYFLAVGSQTQGRGLGREILSRVERVAQEQGARFLYLDTCATSAYAPARQFYERKGYTCLAEVPDFYADGEHKVIYRKTLSASAALKIVA